VAFLALQQKQRAPQATDSRKLHLHIVRFRQSLKHTARQGIHGMLQRHWREARKSLFLHLALSMLLSVW
jgi:hypothetical protein